jgi:hypothetical protein
MSNQTVVYLSLKKAKKAIVLCVMAQNYLRKYEGGQKESFGAILWGESGIGKNGITNNLGVELSKATGENWIQVDANLSGMSPEDIQGVPVVRGTPEQEVLKYFSSLQFPKNTKGIFRLDEIDRPAWYQTLIEMMKFAVDRTDHRSVLPEGMFVLGMGNGSSDTNTVRLSDHAKGRFCHIYVSENVAGASDDHIEYMRKQGFSESLIRMVQSNPIKTRDEFEEIAIYHKRSISFANAILAAYYDLRKQGSDFSDVLLACLAGVIGKSNAIEVYRLEELSGLPSLHEIVQNPLQAIIPEDLSLRHRFLTILVHDVKSDCNLAEKLLAYIIRYPSEMARYAIDRLVLDCPDLVKCSAYINWSNKK